tara:strand:+ start:557 stop:733 length:177 start_codon:yes stop_codon:yes gene_type:complete
MNSGKAIIDACKKLEHKISEFHLATNNIDSILADLAKVDFVFLALHEFLEKMVQYNPF